MAFCSNCGAKIEEGVKFCSGCGTAIGGIPNKQIDPIIQQQSSVIQTQSIMADEKYCFSCGAVIKKAAEICPKCGVNQSSRSSTTAIDVYCTSCGKTIKREASVCPFCGVKQFLSSKKEGKFATASLVLGIIGIVPIWGLVTSILAIIFGIIGLKSEKKNRARAGLILGIIFIFVSIVLFSIGKYPLMLGD